MISTNPNRDGQIEAFKSPSSERFFLVSVKAGGAGLNLQHGCHHVILYAPLAGSGHDQEQIIAAIGKEQQSIDRVRRQFQKHKVTVHRLLLKGPEDEPTLDAVLTELKVTT